MSVSWLYAGPNEERVPFEHEQFHELISNGNITAETLVWTESMDDWQACGELYPELFAPTAEAIVDDTEPKRPKLVVPSGDSLGPALATSPLATPAATTTPIATGDADGDIPTLLANQEKRLIREVAAKLQASSGWMTFLGVLFMIISLPSLFAGAAAIIAGLAEPEALVPALITGSIVIAIGALMIWLGLLLISAASGVRDAALGGRQIPLKEALGKLATYFKILGICALLYIVAIGLVIAFAGLLASQLGPDMLPTPADLEMSVDPFPPE